MAPVGVLVRTRSQTMPAGFHGRRFFLDRARRRRASDAPGFRWKAAAPPESKPRFTAPAAGSERPGGGGPAPGNAGRRLQCFGGSVANETFQMSTLRQMSRTAMTRS